MDTLPKNNTAVLLYVTFPDKDEARSIARLVLSEKLVACVNIAAPHTACYTWNEEYTESSEVAVIFKTSIEKADITRAFITERHSYECPCILTISAAASAEFSNWINLQTASNSH